MDFSELERLVALVRDSDIRELTLRQGDSRITIRKPTQPQIESSQALTPYVSFGEDEYEGVAMETIDVGSYSNFEQGLSAVTAPLVGVFKHIKPMCGLGARVGQGQVVCEIWAMNIANEVASPIRGKIVDVLVEDGQAVEYGQELFAIEPES